MAELFFQKFCISGNQSRIGKMVIKMPLILAIDPPKLGSNLAETTTWPVKYLNNIVDHRSIKRLINPGMGFGSIQHSQTNLSEVGEG